MNNLCKRQMPRFSLLARIDLGYEAALSSKSFLFACTGVLLSYFHCTLHAIFEHLLNQDCVVT